MNIKGIESVQKRIQEIHKKINTIQNRFLNHSTVHNHSQSIEKPPSPKKDHKEDHSVKKNSLNIRKLIQEIAKKENVSPELINAIVKVESNFNPTVISPKGAIGLMQLMPSTAKELNVNPYNPEENLQGGIRFLKMLASRYQDLDLTLAAYNAGPKNIEKYNGIPPFSETQQYIKKIKKILKQLEN